MRAGRTWAKCASCGRATYRCAAVECAPRVPNRVRRTLTLLSKETCVDAYLRHHVRGEGANTVAIHFGWKTASGRYNTALADAAIDAGRWLRTGAV